MITFRGNRIKIDTRYRAIEWLYFSLRAKHPMTPTLIFGGLAVVVTLLIQHLSPLSTSTLIGAWFFGIFLWSFLEYILHRFGEHELPKGVSPFFFDLHVEHHRDTKTPELILAQPAVVIYLCCLIYPIFLAFTRSWNISLMILAGVGVGYICYEWVHYGTHRFNWNRGLLGYYKRYHLHHHFREPNKAFGVTNPLWDYVFRTHI